MFILRNKLLTKLFRIRYFALNNLDKSLETFIDFNNGYFVELGANDGVNQSNTLYFEHFRGWRGVLIEPYPPNFEALIRNRSAGNFFKCAACVGPKYPLKEVKLVYSNLMTSTLGIESDSQNALDHAKRGSNFRCGRTFVFKAPALSLTQILIEAGAPSFIDLLSLDVEGNELEVLKSIDHSKFKFRYICVESDSLHLLVEYLTCQGYSYLQPLTYHDYLFEYRKNNTILMPHLI